MNISRGRFLRSLGASMAGTVLQTGVAAAAAVQALASRAQAGGTPAGESPAGRTPPAALPAPPAEADLAFHHEGPALAPRIALTFDDGPTPDITERNLDELRRREAHATFFLIGERVAARPDLARRIRDEGHEIGNHTYTHPRLTELADAAIASELQRTQDAVQQATGAAPRWFRPPFGALHRAQAPLAAGLGLRIAMLTADTHDWRADQTAERIEALAVDGARPGAIVLCHDLFPATPAALPRLIDRLREKGLELVTLSDLFKVL